MFKLYELTEQHHKALSELEELELDETTIKDTLEAIKGDIEVKSKAVGAYIANAEAEVKAIKEASAKLANRAKVKQAKMDRLREYLLYNMQANGITRIESPDLVLKTRKKPDSVVIDNEHLIDDKYKKEKVTITVSKTDIKKAIQAGDTVEGAHLEGGASLVIE